MAQSSKNSEFYKRMKDSLEIRNRVILLPNTRHMKCEKIKKASI